MLSTPLSIYFLLSSVNAILRNRDDALRVAKDNQFGGRNSLLHKLLATIVLALGITGVAVYLDALIQYYTAMATLAGQDLPTRLVNAIYDKYEARYQVHVNLGHAFSAFVVLSAIDVGVSTFLLWKRNAPPA